MDNNFTTVSLIKTIKNATETIGSNKVGKAPLESEKDMSSDTSFTF